MIETEEGACDPMGMRFLAPRTAPTVVGRCAEAVGREAGVVARLDADAVRAFLRDGEYDVGATFRVEVGQVAARCPLVRQQGGGWSVEPPPPAPLVLRGLGISEGAARLRSALDAAVERALRPARIAAVTVSGGLDSACIAAAAASAWRRLGREPAGLSFAHVLPPDGPSEIEHARAIAWHLGHAIHELPAGRGDSFEGADRFLAASELPFDGGGPMAWAPLGLRLRGEGVDVLLHGEGGDEALLGAGPPRGRLGIGVRGAVGRLARAIGLARGQGASTPSMAGLRARARGIPHVRPAPTPRAGLAGSGVARDQALRSGRAAATRAWWCAFDRVHGVRSESPFLSPAVADAVLELPDACFPPGAAEKQLLRRAYGDALPTKERDRSKADQPRYEGLLTEEIRAFGPGWIDRFLQGSTIERFGVATMPEARALREDALSGSVLALQAFLRVIGTTAWAQAQRL